jgi:isoamylase
MGDEVARTQYGNNNTYCHDDELNWFDWGQVAQEAELLRFTRHCIAFRQAHPALRRDRHFTGRDEVGSGYPDIGWHGTAVGQPDWSAESRTLAFMLCGQHAPRGGSHDNYLYVALNTDPDAHSFALPSLPDGLAWHVAINTGAPSPEDSWEIGEEPVLSDQGSFLLGGRSVAALVGR